MQRMGKRPRMEDISAEKSGRGNMEKSRVDDGAPDLIEESKISKLLQEDQLESTKAKMGEIREENERLKILLSKMVKDYQALQMHVSDLLQREAAAANSADTHQENYEHELVSLRLGRTNSSITESKNEKKKSSDLISCNNELGKEKLGSDFRFPDSAEETEHKTSSSENSFEDLKEEEPADDKRLQSSEVMKTKMSSSTEDHEEDLQKPQIKKTRVSVRARCDTPTMNDGCQWRKYGQKISKGNPCPRAYYRCTVSPTCPVRKQVQRCSQDISILITTYEGTHDHPLSISATAMASTTSAAASMLLSQSSSSQPAGLNTSTAANLHGSFSSNTSLQNSNRPPPYNFYFPTFPSISTSNSHPTITLDLTTQPSFSYINTLLPAPRFSSSSTGCLNFSSSSSSSSSQTPWMINNRHLNFGSTLPYTRKYDNDNNNNNTGLSLNYGRQCLPHHPHFSYPPHSTTGQMIFKQAPPAVSQIQSSLTETVAAAAKVITSSPDFQSALAAALTSFVGNGGGGINVSGINYLKHVQESSAVKVANPNPVTASGEGCSSSNYYLSKSTSKQEDHGSLTLFSTSPPLISTSSESASGSSMDNNNNNKERPNTNDGLIS